MAASFNDMNVLSTNGTFISRVTMAMVTYCTVVGSEGYTVVFHRERAAFAASVLNAPSAFAQFFANVAAVNATVIGDATQAGTVALTSGNIATQQALITDTDISNAIASQFNSFFKIPEA